MNTDKIEDSVLAMLCALIVALVFELDVLSIIVGVLCSALLPTILAQLIKRIGWLK